MASSGNSLNRILTILTQRMDLAVALGVVMIIFMMILPLPTVLVDLLIGVNIASAVILLMVTMHLLTPLAFSAFPAMLLITTLFRLSLSVTTTRLILLQADAGHVVETFGSFVVGGNLIVGLVVFVILTAVQFIVVTKGAERVAEVAARFHLDGLPGKQMSIDADVRANSLTMAEARLKRGLLEKESQFYGAMDGAMKFVKGDAIAGIVIVLVNLFGGLAIGILQRDMSAGDAMNVYSILTIGEGLVAQIPALFTAIASGILVTRVTRSDESATNIGTDISQQILGQPRAVLIAGGVMLLMAIVPGMPSTIFIVLAAVAIGVSILMTRLMKSNGAMPGDTGGQASAATARNMQGTLNLSGDEPSSYYPAVPLLLDLASDLQPRIAIPQLSDQLGRMRSELYQATGVPLPGVHLRFNPLLAGHAFQVTINEAPFARSRLRENQILANSTAEHLDAYGIAYELDTTLVDNLPTLWCAQADKDKLLARGIEVSEHIDVLCRFVADTVKRNIGQFIGIQEAKFLITSLGEDFPELIKEVQRVLPIQRIAEVLQRLVAEGVSIRNLRSICEALVEWSQKEKDSVLLTEHVRSALRHQIAHLHTDSYSGLSAYLLAPELEEKIRSAVRQSAAGSYLAFEPTESQNLIQQVLDTVGDLRGRQPNPVLLTSMDIRRYVRRLIESDLPHLAVLSYQELPPEVTILPLGRIEMELEAVA